jgi:tRNA (guanine37-N1)-methyltransferase
MFAGVGPFALHIAKLQDAQITAVDINPQATALLKQSMTLNRLQGHIVPVTSDIKDYVRSESPGIADRVIMNHPSGAFNFVQEACHLLKRGGKMHYYDFMGGDDPEGDLTRKVNSLVVQAGRKVREVSLIRRVRDSAPYEYHIVLDAIID